MCVGIFFQSIGQGYMLFNTHRSRKYTVHCLSNPVPYALFRRDNNLYPSERFSCFMLFIRAKDITNLYHWPVWTGRLFKRIDDPEAVFHFGNFEVSRRIMNSYLDSIFDNFKDI